MSVTYRQSKVNGIATSTTSLSTVFASAPLTNSVLFARTEGFGTSAVVSGGGTWINIDGKEFWVCLAPNGGQTVTVSGGTAGGGAWLFVSEINGFPTNGVYDHNAGDYTITAANKFFTGNISYLDGFLLYAIANEQGSVVEARTPGTIGSTLLESNTATWVPDQWLVMSGSGNVNAEFDWNFDVNGRAFGCVLSYNINATVTPSGVTLGSATHNPTAIGGTGAIVHPSGVTLGSAVNAPSATGDANAFPSGVTMTSRVGRPIPSGLISGSLFHLGFGF